MRPIEVVTPESVALARETINRFKAHPDFKIGDRAFVGPVLTDEGFSLSVIGASLRVEGFGTNEAVQICSALGVKKTLRALRSADFDPIELKDAIVRNFDLGDNSPSARRYLRYIDRFLRATA